MASGWDNYKKYQDEQKKKKEESKNQSSAAWENYKAYRTYEDSPEVKLQRSSDYVNNFRQRLSSAYDEYQKTFGNQQYNTQETFNNFLKKYQNQFSDDSYLKYTRALRELQQAGAISNSDHTDLLKSTPYMSDINKSVKNMADYMAQYKNEEEYNKSGRYALKYSGMSDKDLKASADEVMSAYKKATGPEKAALKQEYDWLFNYAPGNAGTEIRSARIKDNEQRIAEIEQELKGFIPYQQGKYTKEQLDHYRELERERDTLRAENNKYSRGETYVTDKYGKYAQNADFAATSKQRKFDTSVVNEQEIAARLNPDNWRTSFDGKTYDQYGNEITQEYLDEWRRKGTVQDKLGVYLGASDEDIANAQMTSNNTNGSYDNILNEGRSRYWDLLTESEKDMYYYLLNKEGQQAAYEYLDDLDITLGRRNNEKQIQKYNSLNWLGKVAYNIGTVPASILGGIIGGIDDKIHQIQGKEINPYSIAHSASNFASGVREQTAQDLSAKDEYGNRIKFLGLVDFGDVYQAIMSGIDSAVGAAFFGNVGGAVTSYSTAASYGYGLAMGMGAMESEARELFEAGATSQEIFTGSLLAGVAEEVFETVSLDKILHLKDVNSVRDWVSNILKSGFIEGSEEFATEVATTLTDMAVRGTQSGAMQSYYNYRDQGLSEGQASMRALRDVGITATQAFIGGAISGAAGGFSRGGTQFARYVAPFYGQASSAIKHNNMQGIYDTAGQFDVDYSKAQQKVNDFLKEGRGRAGAVSATANVLKNVDRTRTSQNTADMQQKLQDQGISERRAKKIAQTLSDIMERKRTDDIEFNRDIDIGAFIGEEDLKVFKGDKNVAIDVLKQAMGGSVANRNFEYEARLEGDKETAEYIKNERIAAAAPKLSFDGTVDGQSSSFTYDHIDGDTLYVKTADGQVVNADDVQTTNRNAIQVMQDSVLFGDDGARAYLNGYEGGSASEYRQTFTNIYNQAKAGANVETLVSEMVAQGVSEKVARLAAYEGQNAYEAIQSNDVEQMHKYIDRSEAKKIEENVKQAAKGQETEIERENRAALKGVKEDLKKAFTNKRVEIRDADIGNLSQEDQGQLAAVTMMLTALGRKVVIMSNTDSLGNTTLMSGMNGGFDRNSNTYYINTNVMEHAYLNIGLHETVHDISKNQPKIFKQIRDILEKYCNEYKPEALLDQGAEYDKAKNTYSDVASESELTEIAMEEWVANTVTGIIADPDTFTQFADKFMTESERKTFMNLLDRLLEALKEAFDKIKNVLGWSQIQTVQDDLNLLQQLRDLLFEGYQGIRNDFDIEHQTEETRETLKNLSDLGIEIDDSGAAHFNYSVRTWGHSEAELQKMADALMAAGFDPQYSESWVADIDSVYSLVMENEKALSYENDERYSWLKKNSDYSQGSIDFNNNCPKRVEFTTIFDRLLKEFPNSVLTDQDFETIRGILKKNGIVVTCGICFVEDRRQALGTVAQAFIDMLKDGTLAPMFKSEIKGDTYIPTQYDLITYEGYYNLWKNHEGIYKAFKKYNNHRGMASIRLVEGIGEYNNQIRKWSKRTITSKNNKGGLRIWSTSDADPRTMLDVMQIVNDAAAKGLQIQGYTKKPWFARLVQHTGIRLLRSHIPSGIGYETVNGKEVLTVDNVEGINTRDPDYFDSTYSPYIGNNIIGINDHQIRLAMLDPRFDQIIPFHSNQKRSVLDKKGIGHYHNYKLEQTEKVGYYSEGKGEVGKQINIYTDVIKEFEKRGKPIKNKWDFVNAYLQVCKERDVCPVFCRFLNKDENGDYIYTEGFHKFLVDYKTFTKDGYYIPQVAVRPQFDAEFATEVLRKYVKFDEIINRKSNPVASEKAYGEIKAALKDKLMFSANTEAMDEQYMAAVNAKDMVTAQRMVDEAAERAGYIPSNMFHGSMNATFHVFDKSKANPEGNSGAGFYFTTNREDAEQNYADVEGADNFFKTSALADKIFEDGEWNGIKVEDYDQAKQLAKDLLNKEPGTYEVYLKYDNPYYRDYRNSTDIYEMIMDDFDESVIDRDDYDSDEDYEDDLMYERERQFSEAIETAVMAAYQDLENTYEYVDGPTISEIVNAIVEQTYGYDSLTWGDILEALGSATMRGFYFGTEKGEAWGEIEFTRAFIEALGYDAIYDKEVSTKFNQLNRNGREADHIIVFHPNQIKLSDPVTYDDQGNVIPLSKRFNTNKDDIRFSANIDSEGNKLSEEQQRYFEDSKVRDDEGNLLVMYHGTDAYENFTVFKKGKSGYLGPGIYLSSSKAYADRYASKNGYDGRVYTSYVNITNPLIVTSDNPAIEILGERVARRREEKNSYATTWITNSDIKKLQAKGYDGIIWKYGNIVEVSVWEPNQIKNTDNKNPTENPDIRYSSNEDEIHAYLNDINSQIKQDMTQEDRYEVLKDAWLPAITYDTKKINDQLSVEAKDNIIKEAFSRAEKELRTYLRANNILNTKLTAPGIKFEFDMSAKGLSESLHKQKEYGGSYENLLYALDNLNTLLENSLLINKHSDKYKGTDLGNEDINSISVLMSLMGNEDTLIPVKLDIKEYKGQPGKLYVTVTTGEIKKADVMETVDRDNSNISSLIPATYILKSIVQNVNEEDRHLLKYFPDQMLTQEQIAWKNKAIEEDIASVYARAKNVPEDFTIRYSSNSDTDYSSLNNSDENNVENLKKTIGDQYRLTVGKEMTIPAAEKIARDVTRRVNSQADKAELAAQLKNLFDDAARQGKDLDTDTFMERGAKIMRDVLGKSATFDRIRYEADEPIRKYLRETGISLNELQQGEARYLFDSVANYRRALFGSVLIKNNGIPLDVAWQELNKMFPYLFPSDINDGDMVSYLYDAAKALSKANYYVNEYGFDLDGAAAYEFAQVVGDYTDNKRIKTFVQQLRTYGKRYLENEMKEIRKTRREKMAIQSRLYEEQRKRNVSLKNEIANLNRELSGEAQNIERDITFLQSRLKYAEPGVDELSIREQIADLEQDKANLEARYREEIRNKTAQLQEGQEELEKIGKEYIKAGSTNTSLALDARKAAIGTKSAVKLREQKEAQEIRTLQNNIRKKASNLMSRLISGTDTRHVPENLRQAVTGFLQAVDLGWNEGTFAAEKWMADLNVLAEKMQQYNEVNGNFQVDSMIIDQLREMASRITDRLSLAGKNLRTMSINELNTLDDALSLVNAAIYNTDRLLADDRKQRASTVAERSIEELGKKKQRKNTSGLWGRVTNFFTIDQLDSFSYAERLGGAYKDTIFKNLRKAFDKKVRMVQEGMDAYDKAASVFGRTKSEILKKIKSMSGNNASTKTFTLDSGKKITLNTAQIMELYLLNERDQARIHLYNGGITVEEYKAKDGTIKKQEMVQVTEDDIDRITSTLTKEQRKFANDLQKYASSNMSEWGNDVSLTLWGVKKFTEANYWPITVDDNTTDAVSQDKKNGNVGLYHLKNIGMSKQVNPKATNALVLGDVIDTYIKHVDEMTSYAAYTIPLDDAMKWYNYKNGNKTVQRSIESYMGKEGKAWFTDFIKALNNSQDMSGGMDFADTMIRNAKTAAISLNLRVAIQQPSAFARASEVLSPKYLTKIDNLKCFSGAKEAQEHASIAQWKSWGFRDVNVGKDLRGIMVGDGNWVNKLNDAGGWLAGKADDVTWGAIWNACKAEVEEKQPSLVKGSQEYWDAISDRFSEVIDRTQVVDSPFHRSKAMRSKNALWKMYTAFMSEPTKSYNMFYKTISNAYQGNFNAETRKAVGRATMAFVAATVLNSVLASIVDVARDTDDEDWWEKYLKGMKKNMLDGLNPLNLIPIGKDVMNIFDGYEASRIDLDAVSDLIQQFKRAGSMFTDGEKHYNWKKIAYDTVMAASKITGIPAGNFWRGINSICNLVGVDTSVYKSNWNTVTAKTVAEDMYEYFQKGNMDGFQQAFDKYVESEVNKMLEEDMQTLEETGQHKYDSTESMQNKATKAVLNKLAQQLADNEEQIAEAYLAKSIGDGSEVVRIRNEYIAKGIPEEVFDKAVNLYGSSMNVQPEGVNELNSKLYSYDDLYAAIESGDLEDIGYIYDEMIEDSQSVNPEEYISNKAVKNFKEQYFEYVASGQTTKANQLENTLEQAFGLTADDLKDYQAGYLKYTFTQKVPEAENIELKAFPSFISKYNEFCKPANVPEKAYYNVYMFEKESYGEVNSKGKSIPYSKCVKVMAYIDSLNVTAAQKTALALCYYGKSTVDNYKLW